MQTSYKNKKVTVIGLGKTGLSCVDFLLAKQADVRVIDTRTQPAGAEQLAKKCTVAYWQFKPTMVTRE
ncbi:UDP-N-acetylmuramoylalanine--D-glutamate ligase [Pasteurella multocida]|nr:UDP-N-acetylmuramoylalanine--D-glutamate ligase [Pasteurella multocida]